MKIELSPFLQWKFNIFLYLTFGWGLAKFYIFFIGKFYFFVNQKEKQIIKDAIFDVIKKVNPEIDTERVTKKVLKGIFSHYYEKLFMAFEQPKKAAKFLDYHVSSNDLVVLRKCLLEEKGVIVITGHYGAIEYIPTLLAVNNFDISMIAKFKTKQLKRKVFSQAKEYNIRLIDAENTGNILKYAIKELKKNRVLVTQCDEIEEWRPSKKKKTSFLGQVTGLDRTINIIQRRTGAEVVFGVIHRYNLNEYKLLMYPYEDMLKMLHEVSPSSVGETVLKFFEQFIYYYPEQWYQWKKYPKIKNTPTFGVKADKPTGHLFLKPLLEKI